MVTEKPEAKCFLKIPWPKKKKKKHDNKVKRRPAEWEKIFITYKELLKIEEQITKMPI